MENPLSTSSSNRRKRSPYWKHFKLIDDDDKQQIRAKCEHCHQMLAIGRGCTGNLARHLRKKHPAIMMFLEEEFPKSTEVDGESEDDEKYQKVFLVANSPTQSDEEQEADIFKTKKIKHVTKNRNSLPPSEYYEESPVQAYRSPEDRFDIFGKLVAMKMKALPDSQKLIAEKLINDTLHEAESGNLNKFCCLTIHEVEEIHENIIEDGQVR